MMMSPRQSSSRARWVTAARRILLAACHAALYGAAVVRPAAVSSVYADVLGLSYQFFEAQMSGSVPSWSRAAVANDSTAGWRRPSHLLDGIGPDSRHYPNANLTGGWYENGGYVKLSLTQGAAASLLAYGALSWERALRIAGEWRAASRQVQWAADYLVRCYYDKAQGLFAAQVGDLYTEDLYWGPADGAPQSGSEGQSGWRPVWSVKRATGRGSDVVSQATAAVAAAAIMVARDGDFDRATGLLRAAEELYELAFSLTGTFIAPDGNSTVLNRSYRDDRTWALTWLCRWQLEYRGVASVNVNYCTLAVDEWNSMQNWRGAQPFLSTETMHLATALHLRDLYQINGGYQYIDIVSMTEFESMIDSALTWWMRSDLPTCDPCDDVGLCRTPDGFTIMHQFRSAYYTTAMAFVALASSFRPGEDVLNDRVSLPAGQQVARQCWARGQVDYLLGSNSRRQAFVTGIDRAGLTGVASPSSPRHRGAACSAQGQCSPPGVAATHSLVGALVGGPGLADEFTDNRNAPGSVVSIEANAALAGALLGMAAMDHVLQQTGLSWPAYCSDPDAGKAAVIAYSHSSMWPPPPTAPSPPPPEGFAGGLTSVGVGADGSCFSGLCIDPAVGKYCGLYIYTQGVACNELFSVAGDMKAVLGPDGVMTFYSRDVVSGDLTEVHRVRLADKELSDAMVAFMYPVADGTLILYSVGPSGDAVLDASLLTATAAAQGSANAPFFLRVRSEGLFLTNKHGAVALAYLLPSAASP
ncbi:hypothetical protein GPECTOR_18g160 [Gonium pectorale]|uniref:cellulase n=1 Tax=Gonium pectorale TaxID=33097 RepID=A0A150GJM7_GONPE|nr:hypothetical protein GPECTOR_18g160 [Gonium pectorale]|eukprot:KXZ50006.1 hypothetical protein GPECTOR_18g160 [Gonium pectorale]